MNGEIANDDQVRCECGHKKNGHLTGGRCIICPQRKPCKQYRPRVEDTKPEAPRCFCIGAPMGMHRDDCPLGRKHDGGE